MTIRRRTVTGNIQKANAAWPSARVAFRLWRRGSYTVDSQIPPEPVYATTDENGDYSIELWCDDDGLLETNYGCWLPDRQYNSGRSPAFEFDLAYGDGSPIRDTVLRGSTDAGETPEVEDLLNALIEAHAAAVETIYTETFTADGVLDIGQALRALILIDTTDGDVTVQLPPAADVPRCEITLKKIADDNLGIVDGDSSETIDGQLVFNLEMNYQTVKVIPIGDAWYVI